MKKTATVSPFYLSVLLNSELFQRIFRFMMSGSTGRQRIRKSNLKQIRLPILSEYISKAFSQATEISMEILSETLRMLIQLQKLYEQIIHGENQPDSISSFIVGERRILNELTSSQIINAEKYANETHKIEYKIKTPNINRH